MRAIHARLGLAALVAATVALAAPTPARADWSSAGVMATARALPLAGLLGNGDVLVAGGYTSASGTLNVTATAELYNPTAGTWTTTSDMSVPRGDAGGTALAGGDFLAVGGVSSAIVHAILSSAERYSTATGTWSSAGLMSVARQAPTVVRLADGRVLVAGGVGFSGYLASAELYNPATNGWSAAGSMSTGRTRATGTLLSDGRVLVAGGEGAPGGTTVALNSAEIYDPTTNSWSSAGNMQVARRLAAASRLADGRVLVTGGETTGLTSSTATAEIYDPTTNSWSSAAAMHDARYGQAALTLPDGRVLVIGGDELGSSPADLNGVEAYDLSTNTWTQLPSLTDAREQFGAVALPDGGVVVVGGDQYDPSTSSFVQLATAERYTPPVAGTARADTLPVGRWGHVAVRLQDGRVLIAGGSTATSNYTSSVEVYDPDTNAWSNAAPMNEGRQYFAAVTLKDGRVLAVGGFGGPDPADIGYLASAEVYDPVQDRWTEVPPMSTPRESLTATLLPSGSVLVAGGLNSVGAVNTAELYDPKTNSWSPAGTMSNARESPAAVLLKTGKVLVLGGIDPSGLGVGLRSADLYDPATNAFTPAAPMTIGRDHPLATRLLNGRVLVAGGFVSNSLPVTRSAELYDPATNTWSPAGTMAQERTFGPGLPAATITTLTSGNVLVTGGTTSNGSTLSSAEAYIPALNNWLTVPGLQTPRASQTATLLTDGRVLIASGSGTVTPWLTTSELFAAPAPVSIYDYVFDPTASSTRPGQGVLWTDRQGTHTVVDSALLGGTAGAAQPLFASASLTAGKTFSYTFFAAGTYPYQSTAGEPTAMAGSVTVPVAVTVTRDGTDRLQVTWACTTLPGYAEKVQERFKPLGSSKFGSWATWAAPDGTANWLYTSGLFTPTTTGTYQFRARLLNTDTGHVSGWSTASPLTLRSL